VCAEVWIKTGISISTGWVSCLHFHICEFQVKTRSYEDYRIIYANYKGQHRWAQCPNMRNSIIEQIYIQISIRIRKFRSEKLLNVDFPSPDSENGASDYPCDEIYAGEEPLSEIENRNLRDFATTHREHIKLYLTFHSYGEVSIHRSFCSAIILIIILKLTAQFCTSLIFYINADADVL
jgi:hypothetical protein